jgi:hypothetical protein
MKHLILFLVIITPFLSNGQVSSKKDTTVVVNLPHRNYDNRHSAPSPENHVLKFSPLGFTTGSFPVYYEKVINDFFTIQAGAGFTTRDYLRSAIQTSSQSIELTYPWGFNSNFYDRSNEVLDYSKRSNGIGYTFSLQPRLYFDSEAPDGAYVGVSYIYSRYNMNIPGIIVDSSGGQYYYTYIHKGPKKKEFEKITDMMVYFGYQDLYDHLSVDYTFGMGIRNVSGSKYIFGADESVYPINTIEGFAPYKQTLFNFNLGIRIGYHF